MASSRKTGTNEQIKTYGNATRQYTALATWEAATDTNLVTAAQSQVLECYDDAASFNDRVTLDGSTTNASYFRIIRPASGQGHDGTPNNGVYFESTIDLANFNISEQYSQIQDIIARLNINSVTSRYTFIISQPNGAIVGCIAYDSANIGTGGVHGLELNNSSSSAYAINCLVISMDNQGFSGTGNGTHYFYNCTSVNNITGFLANTGTNNAKNCVASGNTTNDWVGTWTKTTCTAEGANPTYVNPAGNDFHLASADTVCINQGTDLSADAVYAFDDDIDKTSRSGAWDIGADELRRIMLISQFNSFVLPIVLLFAYNFIKRDFNFIRKAIRYLKRI